jgi:TPR repeat protein
MMRRVCIAIAAGGLGVAACGGGGSSSDRAQPVRAAAPAPPAKLEAPAPAAPEEPAEQAPAPEQKASACEDAQKCNARGLEALRAGHAERAAEFFELACDGELGPACFRLGEMLRDGKGVKPDDARANELFTRGCRYGSESACDALGH